MRCEVAHRGLGARDMNEGSTIEPLYRVSDWNKRLTVGICAIQCDWHSHGLVIVTVAKLLVAVGHLNPFVVGFTTVPHLEWWVKFYSRLDFTGRLDGDRLPSCCQKVIIAHLVDKVVTVRFFRIEPY